MRLFLLFGVMAALGQSGCGGNGDSTPTGSGTDLPGQGQPVAIAFADTALEQAIRQALAQPAGDLSAAGVHSLTTLSASGRGIVDLRGIGQLDSLTSLDLSNNRIFDLTPLDSLAHLRMLDLSWNQVSDLTPLAGLQALEFLAINGNPVSDLTPLLELGALGSLEAVGNPLDEASLASCIPSLQTRGIQVWLYDPEAGTVEDPDSVPVLPGRLVFSAMPEDVYGASSSDIYACDLTNCQTVQVTDSPADERQPVWSADGRRIAFIRSPTPNHREVEGDLCVVEVDRDGGHHLVNLSDGQWIASGPTWSPDGRRIACTRWTSASSWQQISVVDLEDGSVRQLTEAEGYSRDPTWSPDGTRIAFIGMRPGLAHAELFAMDPDGGNVTQLTDDELAGKRGARWSPDGARIVFHCGTIYSIPAAGVDRGDRLAYGRGYTPCWLMGTSRLIYCFIWSDQERPTGIRSDICLLELATGARLDLTDLLRRYRFLSTLVNMDPDWTATEW